MDDEEEGALLGVKEDEEDLEEKIWLVQAQNPGAAQDDKLGQDLEHDQSANNTNTKWVQGGWHLLRLCVLLRVTFDDWWWIMITI